MSAKAVRHFGAPVLKEQEITIGDASYKIREMTGSERDIYNTKIANITRFEAGSTKPAGFRTMENIQSWLVASCLKDAQNRDVKLETINDWPASLVQDLYDACREINGMLTPAEVEAAAAPKKDPGVSDSSGTA